jgi:hypothetical protein
MAEPVAHGRLSPGDDAMTLEPVRSEIEQFVEALFRYAAPQGFVAVRSFFEDDDAKPARLSSAGLGSGMRHLIDVAEDDARRAAQNPRPIVFCPPIAVFADKARARERDIAQGLALTVECDTQPMHARSALERLLGPATVVVESGGKYVNGQGEPENKVHLHWRLAAPAQGADLVKLKTARDLAARFVGGDPSNKPVCHPIRWPGSWHRKGEPRLCRIAALEPDREIELDRAFAILEEAAKTTGLSARPNGAGAAEGTSGENKADWADLFAKIIAGQDLHDSIASLAMNLLRAHHADASATRLIRALMIQSAAPHDGRWQARYDDIPRAVRTAREKIGDHRSEDRPPAVDQEPPGPERFGPAVGEPISESKPNFRTLKEFCAEFRPISYAVASLMREGSLYTLTGRTGEGKTAFLIILALAIATGAGERLIGRKVKKGRVAFCTAENPDDLRMRFKVACFVFNIDVRIIDRDILVSDNRVAPEDIVAWIKETGETLSLILIDTWQAYFDGKDPNNNAEAVSFTRRFRPLASTEGQPVVIVAAHPIKQASDDNLLPYGGGGTLNEVDGNFTFRNDENGLFQFHWLGKIRGLSFDPLHFRVDRLDSPDVVTVDDERVPMPVMFPVDDESVDARSEALAARDLALLEAIAADPAGSERKWALATGMARGVVQRALHRLKRDRLTTQKARRWRLTKDGEHMVNDAKKGWKSDRASGEPGNSCSQRAN